MFFIFIFLFFICLYITLNSNLEKGPFDQIQPTHNNLGVFVVFGDLFSVFCLFELLFCLVLKQRFKRQVLCNGNSEATK